MTMAHEMMTALADAGYVSTADYLAWMAAGKAKMANPGYNENIVQGLNGLKLEPLTFSPLTKE